MLQIGMIVKILPDAEYENLWSQCQLLGWKISKELFWKQYIQTEWVETDGFWRQQITGYKNVDRLKMKLVEHGAVFMTTEQAGISLPKRNWIKVKTRPSPLYWKFWNDRYIAIDSANLGEFELDADFYGSNAHCERELIGDTSLTRRLYARQLCGLYMHKAMGVVLNTFESMQQASGRAVDTAAIREAREEWAKAGTAFDAIEENIRNANNEQQKFNNSIRGGNNSANGLLSTIKKIAVAAGGIVGINKVQNISDKLASTKARLNLLVDDGGSVDVLEQKIMASAQRSRSVYFDTASAVAKLGLNAGNAFNGDMNQVIAFMEQVNKQFVIGGATAQEQSNAMIQLMAGTLMPITPSKVTVKINNQNKTMTLINGEEINILKAAGLSDVSFELVLPQVSYPFSNGGAQSAAYYLSLFERLKVSKTPFQFILNRQKPGGGMFHYTNLTVGLETYEITDDAGEGFDVKVKINLKQYRAYYVTNNPDFTELQRAEMFSIRAFQSVAE